MDAPDCSLPPLGFTLAFLPHWSMFPFMPRICNLQRFILSIPSPEGTRAHLFHRQGEPWCHSLSDCIGSGFFRKLGKSYLHFLTFRFVLKKERYASRNVGRCPRSNLHQKMCSALQVLSRCLYLLVRIAVAVPSLKTKKSLLGIWEMFFSWRQMGVRYESFMGSKDRAAKGKVSMQAGGKSQNPVAY